MGRDNRDAGAVWTWAFAAIGAALVVLLFFLPEVVAWFNGHASLPAEAGVIRSR